MRKVAIAGIGFTKIKEHWSLALKDLFAEAALKAFDDSGMDEIDTLYVSNMTAASIQGQLHLGAMMADSLGKKGVSAVRIEAASASGGVAFHEGVKAIASGMCDSVLVGGVEKMSDALPNQLISTISMSEDQEYTAYTGITKVGLNAIIYKRYMEKFGVEAEDIAMFAVRSHENAVGSLHSQYPFKLSIDRILSSPLEADPIHILECSGVGDGAAAVILKPAEKVKDVVEVMSTSVATDTFYLEGRKDILTFEAIKIAAENAFKKAQISTSNIDVLEVHDETTITGVISLEDLGFVEKGKGAKYVAEGFTTKLGEIPTNTFGGLKARGNPLGATGLYQICEVTMQLRGEAGQCQVEGARTGLAQNLGGIGSTCSVNILRLV